MSAAAETGVRVPSMCLSAHRRFPLGSEDDAVRRRGWRLCVKRFSLRRTSWDSRHSTGVGYDVYHQQADETRCRFRDGLKESVDTASRARDAGDGDHGLPAENSISKALGCAHYPQ